MSVGRSSCARAVPHWLQQPLREAAPARQAANHQAGSPTRSTLGAHDMHPSPRAHRGVGGCAGALGAALEGAAARAMEGRAAGWAAAGWAAAGWAAAGWAAVGEEEGEREMGAASRAARGCAAQAAHCYGTQGL